MRILGYWYLKRWCQVQKAQSDDQEGFLTTQNKKGKKHASTTYAKRPPFDITHFQRGNKPFVFMINLKEAVFLLRKKEKREAFERMLT